MSCYLGPKQPDSNSCVEHHSFCSWCIIPWCESESCAYLPVLSVFIATLKESECHCHIFFFTLLFFPDERDNAGETCLTKKIMKGRGGEGKQTWHLHPCLLGHLGNEFMWILAVMNTVLYPFSAHRSGLLADIPPGLVPIVYHPDYNISFLGLEKLHPFDAGKWGKVIHFLRGEVKREAERLTERTRPQTNAYGSAWEAKQGVEDKGESGELNSGRKRPSDGEWIMSGGSPWDCGRWTSRSTAEGLKAEGKSSVGQKLAPLHTPLSRFNCAALSVVNTWICKNFHKQRVQTKSPTLLTEEKSNLCKFKIKKGDDLAHLWTFVRGSRVIHFNESSVSFKSAAY